VLQDGLVRVSLEDLVFERDHAFSPCLLFHAIAVSTAT
jgi:hypothetical protein